MLRKILFIIVAVIGYSFGEDAIDYKFQAYIDDNHVQVLCNETSASKKINDHFSLSVSYLLDAITSASRKDYRGLISKSGVAVGTAAKTSSTMPDGVSSATKTDELRHQPSATIIYVNDFAKMLGGSKNSDNPTTISITGINSQENDYTSRTVSGGFSQDLFERNTTLGVRYSKTYNTYSPAERYINLSSPGWNYYGNGKRQTDTYSASVAQGITTTTIASLILSYTYDRGYLERPYNLYEIESTNSDDDDAININGKQFYHEFLPTTHKSATITGALNQYIPFWNGMALHIEYRYYTDSWSLSSNTLSLEWYTYLTEKIIVRPSARVYSQSSAFFYRDKYTSPKNYLTTDIRYRGCNAYTAGIKFQYLVKDFVKPENVSFPSIYPVTVDVGFDYYRRTSPTDSTVLHNTYQYYGSGVGFQAIIIQSGIRFIF